MGMHEHGGHSERQQANRPERDGKTEKGGFIPPVRTIQLSFRILHMCIRQRI
jgi:hypothetical protein